jgi:hypothetical protein
LAAEDKCRIFIFQLFHTAPKKDRMSYSISDCCVVNSSSSSSSMSSIFNRFHLDMGEPESDKGTYHEDLWMGTGGSKFVVTYWWW